MVSNRDKRGVWKHDQPKRGSYAEQRIAELKKERDRYNVNDLGYYNGGVPKAHRGNIRGNALSHPGNFHSPKVHNYLHFNHPDSVRVTSEDAVKFKHYMGTDKADFNRSIPSHMMFYDTDFNYRKDRDYWLKFLLGMVAGTYVLKRIRLESDRSRMTERLEGYKNIPGHQYHNRGGVIVLKDFIGFEKYYQSGDDLMAWYKKVYPQQMK